MPIQIIVPGTELYDESSNRFIDVPETTLIMEHSLVSISKWEMKWHKPYLISPGMSKKDQKRTKAEELDYFRCMILTQNGKEPNPNLLYALTKENKEKITAYINDPMTATKIKNNGKTPGREIVTNEVIYYWMAELGIPFNPCEKWHINRLLTLIEVASINRQPPKKMSRGAIMRQNHSLNAARRAAMGSRG